MTYEEKVANGVALGCDRCHGRPPLPEDERLDEDTVAAMIGSARELMLAAKAGMALEFEEVTPEQWKVIVAVEELERQVDRAMQFRLVEALTRS